MKMGELPGPTVVVVAGLRGAEPHLLLPAEQIRHWPIVRWRVVGSLFGRLHLVRPLMNYVGMISSQALNILCLSVWPVDFQVDRA